MDEPVIVAARRSAVVPRGGAFAGVELHDLGAAVLHACLDDAGLPADAVDEVICSNAIGEGGNPARLIALAAGLPDRVAGLSIDRQCVGGLDALMLARALIRSGQAQAVVTGGAESYSRRPERRRMGPAGPLAYDQARFTPWPERDPDMSEAAARLAETLGLDRARQEAWAVDSHARARAARERLRREIVPLAGVADDPFTRALTPAVAARAPVLAGTVTTATTAVSADAAAFCLMLSAPLARRLGLTGMRIRAGATRGDRPEMPGLAPVGAARTALETAGLTAADLTTAEVMEAYAVQAIACVEGIGLDPARVNRGGGALARGHPIGASGAILAVRLWHELQAGETGLAAIAGAGGLGTALIFDR
ncbi:MAG: thiolase family protein [Paracoccaceae bacterium]